MKETYSFPAILYYDNDGISIEFPDLPGCLPCAHSTEEAIKNTREALGLHLWSMEKDNDEIPEPTDIKKLAVKKGSIPLLVDVFMPPIRERLNNKYIKKTISIPAWLNAEAEKQGVNFSQILQNGLKNYLRIES